MVGSQVSPHRARRTEIAVAGDQLAALELRPDADPSAVALLVPGYTGSKEDFAPLLDPLAAAGLQVVAIDLPGQHESRGPDSERAYLTDALGATVVALVGELSARHSRVLLLGHSYGGLVARAAVLGGAPVCGLTLLDSGPSALPDGERRAVLDFAEPVLRTEGIEAVQRLREARDGVPEPPALADLLRARFLGSTPAGLLGMATALREEPDRVDDLAAVLRCSGVPALVACGADDDAWPVDVQREMARRLGAEFAVVPEAAHTPNLENPDGLLAALLPAWRRWLAS